MVELAGEQKEIAPAAGEPQPLSDKRPDEMTQEELDAHTAAIVKQQQALAEEDPVEKERSDEMKSELR